MIICLIGTRAQLVKMAPVLLEMERRRWKMLLIMTGQHEESMSDMLQDFGIRMPFTRLYSGPEISSMFQVASWFTKCLFNGRKLLAKGREKDVILVHGDTFSTLLGALIGRLNGIKVAHIESGLRSFNLLQPFPEEITRLAVFKLSDMAFCPGDWAVRNLQKFPHLNCINTHHNTLLDALNLVIQKRDLKTAMNGDYAVCSIHRFENLFSKKRLGKIVELIHFAAKYYSIIFVMHPITRKKLKGHGYLEQLNKNAGIIVKERMTYSSFVRLLASSKFVITDGGSNQEELSYMGIPTFLMRQSTERQEGLGSTAVLGNYDIEVLESFISTLSSSVSPPYKTEISPTEIILEHLKVFNG